VHQPRALALLRALEITRLPMLNGHGIELTSTHNAGFIDRVEDVECELVQRNLRDYGVGYVVGSSAMQLEAFEECLGIESAFTEGDWWVIATGHDWESVVENAVGLARNSTWTEFHWSFDPVSFASKIRLPIANSAPWTADADGQVIPIESTADGMMKVTLPVEAKRLRLRYRGFTGEWASVVVSALALLAGIVVVRIRSSRGALARSAAVLPAADEVYGAT
jgi:hypothetical protein